MTALSPRAALAADVAARLGMTKAAFLLAPFETIERQLTDADAPPTPSEPAPSFGTPAGLDLIDAVSLAEQIEAIDQRFFAACQLDAARAERDELRASLAAWEAEEADGWHCGQSIDWSQEIEAATARLRELDDVLFIDELFAEAA